MAMNLIAVACKEAIPRLVEVINEADSRTVEKVNATENAIAAVTKILKYNNSALNVDELLPLWCVLQKKLLLIF